MYRLKQATDCSPTQIGRELGGRDHHIVSQAYKKIAGDMASNQSLKEKVLDIEQRLYSAKPR
jgi:chromosomal replication initiation ATPase DnaA